MEQLNNILYNVMMTYGWWGIALAATIVVTLLVEMLYFLLIYNRIAGFRLGSRKQLHDTEPPVSVVVPLFSENLDYLDSGLARLLTQDYNRYEVVLVYVGNDDAFFADIEHLTKVYAHLSPVHIACSPHYPVTSKMALNVGIKTARHEHLLITTTDATPSSERWVSLMAKGFQYGDIVLGYCGIAPQSGLRNFFFREYRFSNSVAWLSEAIAKRTYSASRHNMGFTKSLYFGVRGFNHLNMNIGEDDLFVQSIATRENVSVVLSPRVTCSEHTWGGWRWWFERVHRYGATHRYYPMRAKITVFVELLCRIIFFAAVGVAVATMPWEYGLTALSIALLRYFVVLFWFIRTARRLGETTLTMRHPLYDVFEPLLRLVIAISTPRKKSSIWG